MTAICSDQSGGNDPSFIDSLGEALGLSGSADTDAVVTAVLDRLTNSAGACSQRCAGTGRVQRTAIPGLAAEFVTGQARAQVEKEAGTMVTNAMQSGRLPPALHAWGAALCRSDPKVFETPLGNSPSTFWARYPIQTLPTLCRLKRPNQTQRLPYVHNWVCRKGRFNDV